MSDYLIHYASPYYDPVKAHEYYEEHKKLKGRKSTAGLNDKGKEAARYVKEQINTEKKERIGTARETKKSNVEAKREQKKAQVEANKSAMQSQIEGLKAQLSGMSTEQKKLHKDSINAQIASLREQNAAQREQLNERFKSERDGLSENFKVEKKQITDEADAKYEAELEKIRNTSGFKKTSKRKKKSS